jgi:hypothetical protein
MPLLQALLALTLGLASVHGGLAITPGFPYGSQKVRGVNVGGWLVLEVRFSGDKLAPLLIFF